MTRKRKAFSILKVPPDTAYSTYMLYSLPHIEHALNLISQGYGEELAKHMLHDYQMQAQGVYKLFLSLIYDLENEEVEY